MDQIRVYAKAMNRTALGIVNAYFKLNPNTTYSQLKVKFPDSLYDEVEGGFFNTIRPVGVFQSKKIVDELPQKNLQQCHFMKEDEILKTSDGVEICVTSSWGKDALDRLTNHVKQYGIVVAESLEGESFKKGEYRLEMIERVLPIAHVPVKKNYTMIYIGIILILIISAYFLFFAKKDKKETEVIPEPTKKEVVSNYPEVITFNNIYFDVNQSTIKNGSEVDLNKALDYFKKNSTLKVLIVGHADKNDTSKEDYNTKLSLDRANSVKNWLTNHGAIAANIETEGKGYSQSIADNSSEIGREKNRRIEFKILKQ